MLAGRANRYPGSLPAVTLDLTSPDYHQTGTLSTTGGATMNGTATWRFVDPATGTVYVLTGNWGASQQ
jgi:hypothetical protein